MLVASGLNALAFGQEYKRVWHNPTPLPPGDPHEPCEAELEGVPRHAREGGGEAREARKG